MNCPQCTTPRRDGYCPKCCCHMPTPEEIDAALSEARKALTAKGEQATTYQPGIKEVSEWTPRRRLRAQKQ